MGNILFFSCKKEKEEEKEEKKYGHIVFKFVHNADGQPFIKDSLMYVNAAGNLYMINELQYFISDVTLYKNTGEKILINADKDIHYVDVDIPSTLTWQVYDKISEGNYDSINFIFGIPGNKNIPYMFVNPPESYMFWPYFLGGPNGGYHYLKLNGKWLNSNMVLTPFDFHLGVGQIYASNVPVVDSIIGYIQNYFYVSLPNSAFSITNGQVKEIQIVMEIQNWFNNPVYDHNVYGSYTMQNQQAMQAIKENGDDVFSIGYIKDI
ncbi:MAG TPA: hypothetical protein P5250_07080 [Bacteroidales bacterium]|nr:hypothetical protein [Bacteroidales bacterium]